MMQRTTFSALALTLAATLAGCTATAPTAPEPVGHEAQIRQRADGFWQARQRNDVAAAYAFTSPSYRKVHDQEFFRVHYAGIPVVASREIADVQCDESLLRCVVKEKYTVSPPMAGGVIVPVYSTEIWLREDGQWWVFRE